MKNMAGEDSLSKILEPVLEGATARYNSALDTTLKVNQYTLTVVFWFSSFHIFFDKFKKSVGIAGPSEHKRS